jgi:hypothetical protein
MKTKNVILGFAAVTLAVGGAFASVAITTDVYVDVQRLGSAFAVEKVGTAISLPNCAATGTAACRVSVTLDTNPTTVKNVQAYRDAAKTQPLFSTSASPVIGTGYNPAGTAIVDARD